MLDERALSERLGVSRTPIREAIAMLEQDGFVKTVPRRGIIVVRRTKNEIVDMIRAWAALEAVKEIAGFGESLTGRLVLFDGLSAGSRKVKLRRDPHCPACGDRPADASIQTD